MGSMHTGLEEKGPEGYDRMAVYFAERAKGGVGMIITGGNAPSVEGIVGSHEEAFTKKSQIPLHKKVTDAVHAADKDCKICLQMLHAGPLAKTEKLLAPSAIKSPISRLVPNEMTEADIERTIQDFIRCATYAKEAGYDGVEIIGSAGYLISTFLLEKTNCRTDKWGIRGR